MRSNRRAWLLLILFIAACASVGRPINWAAVETIKAGMDRETVISLLGEPYARTASSDGREILVWVHTKASPISANSESFAVTLIDGKVTGTNLSTTGPGSGPN